MNEVRTIRVALAGCGTVGGGVCEIVGNRGDALAKRTGLRFQIVQALVRDRSKPRPGIDPARLTEDAEALARCRADMVVEVMGGTTTARQVVLGALQAGVPVVTANKALLAEHGAEVYAAARKSGTCVAFEASCAGGLPIVGALLHGLQGNRVSQIAGIFNSTCNFVLTQMLEAGVDFDAAVRLAQEAGYAEADPTLDISGGDTAHKLTILASLAFGADIRFDRIETTGIESLTLADLSIARDLGYACKLLGVGRCVGDELAVAVYPALVRAEHPLAGLTGTSSGVIVDGDVVGRTLYAGAGAGSLPTASAVVADMIDVAGGTAQATFDTVRMFNDQTAQPRYRPPDQVESGFYVRCRTDRMAVDALGAALRDSGVNVDRVEPVPAHDSVVAITASALRADVDRAVGCSAGGQAAAADQPVILRVHSDESC